MIGRLFGLVALLLGVVGFIACSAGVAGVWVGAGHVGDAVDQASDSVTGFSADLRSKTDEAASLAHRSHGQVEIFRQQLARSIAEGRQISPNDLERVRVELRAMVGHVRGWTDAVGQVQELADMFAESVDTLATALEGEGGDKIKTVLQQVWRDVEAAKEQLQEISDVMDEVQTDEERQGLLVKCLKALLNLGGGAESFSESLSALESTTARINDSVAGRINLWAGVATAIVLWLALGQWCLAGWGMRKLRGKG